MSFLTDLIKYRVPAIAAGAYVGGGGDAATDAITISRTDNVVFTAYNANIVETVGGATWTRPVRYNQAGEILSVGAAVIS